MLDASDIRLLEHMFTVKFEEQEKKFDHKLEIRLGELEVRIGQKIRQECDRVRQDIIDVIDDNIQPQINALAARVSRLERKIA